MQRRQFLQYSAAGLCSTALPLSAWARSAATSSVHKLPAHLQNNPLLQSEALPRYADVRAEHIAPAVRYLLAQGRQLVRQIEQLKKVSWETAYLPLQEFEHRMNFAWGIAGDLNSLGGQEAWRKAYETVQPEVVEFYTQMGQNRKLYQVWLKLKSQAQAENLGIVEQKALDNALLDFRLAGVALPAKQQQRYRQINKRLAELSRNFANNVLDGTRAWSKNVLDVAELAGLPEHTLRAAKQSAEAKKQQGYRLTLDYPVYSAVMTYCSNPALREEMYRAYITRASAARGKGNNRPLLKEILRLRYELAKLLGFRNYADYSLATKMAENPEQVTAFLEDLVRRTRPQAAQEKEDLLVYARKEGAVDVAVWDAAYYAEKQKNALFAVDSEALRPYFPVDKVLGGIFELFKRLYRIDIREKQGVSVWHDDVRFFEVFGADGAYIGAFYLDLYAREGKRGGAWFSSLNSRFRRGGGQGVTPLGTVACNFSAPTAGQPALLLHDEVETLLHELGHCMHHTLTVVDVAAVSGINGVAWDAIEFPSQMMENWVWREEGLRLMSSHYQTGEPLPKDLLAQVLAAKNFRSAHMLLRQMEYALLDFRLHTAVYTPDLVERVERGLREQVSVWPEPVWATRAETMSHIFAGGYAAGYYSYAWSEVLAADAFERFAEAGVFDSATGLAFLRDFLSQGGSRPAMDLFKQFRGRAPKLDALLQQRGIR